MIRRHNTISLAAMLAAVAAPDFAAELEASSKAVNLHVVKIPQGLAVATYHNASTQETVRIFVRDAGVIARDLPGQGPTKFRLTRIEPATPGFLEWYVDGRIWPDIRREYYRPEPWEVLLWKWSPEAAESIAAGALVLREIGKASCRSCGKPHWQHERDDERKVCVDCEGREAPKFRPKKPRWNYEPCQAWRGTVIVGRVDVPTWWCAGMEGQRRKCVKVVSWDGEPFYVDDEDGRGTAKVYDRGGGPDSSHASIPVDDHDSFELIDDGPLEPIEELQPAQAIAPMRVGRNETCPCGSGQKFKKCCGR